MVVVESSNTCAATASSCFYRPLILVFPSLSKETLEFELTLTRVSKHYRGKMPRSHNVDGAIIVIVRPKCP
jgi:hypothetical protein